MGPDPSKEPEKLFEMLGRGEVAGVFQVEGAGMRRLMMEMKPTRFDHIIAAISLYRPGPILAAYAMAAALALGVGTLNCWLFINGMTPAGTRF